MMMLRKECAVGAFLILAGAVVACSGDNAADPLDSPNAPGAPGAPAVTGADGGGGTPGTAAAGGIPCDAEAVLAKNCRS